MSFFTTLLNTHGFLSDPPFTREDRDGPVRPQSTTDIPLLPDPRSFLFGLFPFHPDGWIVCVPLLWGGSIRRRTLPSRSPHVDDPGLDPYKRTHTRTSTRSIGTQAFPAGRRWVRRETT